MADDTLTVEQLRQRVIDAFLHRHPSEPFPDILDALIAAVRAENAAKAAEALSLLGGTGAPVRTHIDQAKRILKTLIPS